MDSFVAVSCMCYFGGVLHLRFCVPVAVPVNNEIAAAAEILHPLW